MPTRQPKGSRAATPTPNAHDAPTGNPSGAEPTTKAAVGPKLDLSRYARGPGAPPEAPTPTAPQRERRPKVEWGELAGIPGILVTDVWTGPSKFGTYVGAELRMPDGAQAVALTQADSVAGSALVAELNAGRFDPDPATGTFSPVPVHVRARISKEHPTGRPMAMLTFG